MRKQEYRSARFFGEAEKQAIAIGAQAAHGTVKRDLRLWHRAELKQDICLALETACGEALSRRRKAQCGRQPTQAMRERNV